MRRIGIALMLGVLTLAGDASWAQSSAEFDLDFYNGTRCMKVEELNEDGIRTIRARNLCNAQVAALICYRIISTTDVYDQRGWYCDYSNLYSPGTTRTISQGGRYHPNLKWAACNAANARCDQVIRSINVRVRDNLRDPEAAGESIRVQTGG